MTDEHDDNGPWAMSSLVISSTVLSVDEIGRKIGQPTVGKSTKTWSADLASDDLVRLDEQLPSVERFLADKIDVLEELAPTCEIYLHLGWTPEAGQDHVVFGPPLIKLLSRIGADIALDTYTASED